MEIYITAILIAYIFSYIAKSESQYRIELVNGAVVKKPITFIVLIPFLALSFVSAFRWRVGTDYVAYFNKYDRYVNMLLDSVISLDEPGIKILAFLSDTVGAGPIGMFSLASFITIGLIVFSIKDYSLQFELSMLLFILTGQWTSTFNGIRQWIACSIIFYGFRYVYKCDFKRYCLIVFIAFLFHKSALFLLPFYFLRYMKSWSWSYLYLLIGALSIYFFFGDFLDILETFLYKTDYGNDIEYMRKGLFNAVKPLRVIILFVPVMLTFFYRDTLRKQTKFGDLIINFSFVNFLILFVAMKSTLIGRLYLYTNIYTIVLIPQIFVAQKSNYRYLFYTSLIVLYSVFWYVEVSRTPNLYNYKTIFDMPIGVK